MSKTASDIIADLPDSVEQINKNPILKPLLDYNKVASMLNKEDASESEYLKQKTEKLNELLDLGIYEDMRIAKYYNDVLEIYKRLLFIMARYSDLADKKMVEVKDIIDNHYISKNQHKEELSDMKLEMKELQDEIKNLMEEKNELKKQISITPKQDPQIKKIFEEVRSGKREAVKKEKLELLKKHG